LLEHYSKEEEEEERSAHDGEAVDSNPVDC